MIALLGGWAYGVALAGLYLAFAWRLGLTLYLAPRPGDRGRLCGAVPVAEDPRGRNFLSSVNTL